ncbi:unnamed protein product [Rotaria sordida]|uniref:Uncharacterized protein n=1 Tax=Rotaria sordida TaxID=392033 RepID=A0A819E5D5_9BILA|nr:unnamed protein product [Rotaria sordida]CAF1127065.1 unnamed protein product [Rotaria sordida]CAF3724633.1 unnamed protein product [Rotaria sordida]CAF3845035.1 unnamed protein product [Rotaria sordida]
MKRKIVDEASHSSISVTDALSITTTTTSFTKKRDSNGNFKKSTMDLFNESVGDIQYEENRGVENKRSAITNEFHHYRRYATEFNLKHRPDAASAKTF